MVSWLSPALNLLASLWEWGRKVFIFFGGVIAGRKQVEDENAKAADKAESEQDEIDRQTERDARDDGVIAVLRRHMRRENNRQ